MELICLNIGSVLYALFRCHLGIDRVCLPSTVAAHDANWNHPLLQRMYSAQDVRCQTETERESPGVTREQKCAHT